VVEAAGMRIRSVHNGCSSMPFVGSEGPISPRLGILAVRGSD
jgi:hypothetical protein